ncbi:hypothetical protein NDI56_01650 [Haloarcula sp. S1CR25-12]|uniref:DUF3592 domain-containing protein n=1 Tax=Haloarcula saliterrae TaxID=2950534 RepID=A0ABU2F799_9EURY|nr:hypothetical protein [Haloarcula sp. S1CR25-12]MDS0258109.1 hypothetical protein [Haloarcula sp. S1CR25-12]
MGRDVADTAGAVLLVLGVAALLVPALVPVQQVLYHQTDDGATMNGSELEAQGYTVVAYENLSERGKEIYVAALRSEDEYTVPDGQGAPEFPYTGAEDFGEVTSSEEYEQRRRLTSIVIERPENASLPPADEPVDRIDRRPEPPEAETTSERDSVNRSRIEQRRQAIARYDLMTVRRGTPPVTDSGTLLRLGSVLAGTLFVGLGGYLRSRP